MKPIIYNGKKYRSVREACAELNLSYSRVARQISEGHSFESLVHKASPSRTSCKPVEIDGVTYRSIRNACEALGVRYATVMMRVYSGLTLEDALRMPMHEIRPVTWKGKKYHSLQSACLKLGWPYRTVLNRVHLGLTLEEAVAQGFSTKARKQ